MACRKRGRLGLDPVLNVLLPPMKITSLDHMWDLIAVEDVNKETVR